MTEIPERSEIGPSFNDGKLKMLQRKCSKRGLFLVPLICLISNQALSQTIYDTKHILDQQNNGCANSNATVCQSVPLKEIVVAKGDITTINAKCPADHPILVGWDATRNEHVSAGISPQSLTDNSMVLIISNNADKKGAIKVVLGCATDRLPQRGMPANLNIWELSRQILAP